jgi:AbrB family looped-hinge helix DNA binding protein
MDAITVDSKGRVLLPTKARKQLGLQPGDVLAFRCSRGMIQLRKVEDPFDALAEHAIAEHDAGRTRNLRDIARDIGLDPDAL